MALVQTADANARRARRDYGWTNCLCGMIDASHIVEVYASDSVTDFVGSVAEQSVTAAVSPSPVRATLC